MQIKVFKFYALANEAFCRIKDRAAEQVDHVEENYGETHDLGRGRMSNWLLEQAETRNRERWLSRELARGIDEVKA